MGASQSKGRDSEWAPPTQEEYNKMMESAYAKGAEDGSLQAWAMANRKRKEQLGLLTAVGCAAVAGIFMFYSSKLVDERAKWVVEKGDSSKAMVVHGQELEIERKRVMELTAINDAQKNMLSFQQEVMTKSNEQFNQLMGRFRHLRTMHRQLNLRYAPLVLEVKNLRALNGSLNQRFMASTVAALVMTLVCAGFAIAAHGGHSSEGSEPSPAPTAGELNVTPPIGKRKEAPPAGEMLETATPPPIPEQDFKVMTITASSAEL